MEHKFKVGDKVKIREDLNVGQYSERGITAGMVNYAGRIVTIISQEITNSSRQNYYLIEEDNQCFSWDETMLVYLDVSHITKTTKIPLIQTKIIRFMLGKESIYLENVKEFMSLMSLLDNFYVDYWTNTSVNFNTFKQAQYPLSVAIDNESLVKATRKPYSLRLKDIEELTLRQLEDVTGKLITLSKVSQFIPTLVDIKDDVTTIKFKTSTRKATKSQEDNFDSVTGFAIAFTKAVFNMNYNELAELIINIQE